MKRRVFIAAAFAIALSALAYGFGILPSGANDEQLDLAELIATLRNDFSDVTHLDTEDVAARLGDAPGDIQVIDVREPQEYAVSHLPGAINIPPDTPDEELLAAVSPDKQVIVYCSVGYRSSVLAQRLQAAGRTNVSNYIGSIFAWANAGHPLQASGQEAKLVHPYDRKWGRYLHQEYRSF